MDVDVTKTAASQQIPINEFQDLFIRCYCCGGKIAQGIQYLLTIAKVPNGDLANHERMHQNPVRGKKQRHSRALTPEMFDPNRGVDEDQRERRRGTGRSWGSVPPSRANRRAASRSINALSASRTIADFS